MLKLLDNLEQEAKKYMKHRLAVESRIKNDILEEIKDTEREIEQYLKALPYVNLSFLSSIMDGEIRQIINRHRDREIEILSSAINDSFEEGTTQADRFLVLTKETSESPINDGENNKQEILLALLLFSRKLIEGLNDDLANKIQKDLYSVYILSKNNGDGITINVQLSGDNLSQYINKTFDNIKNRSETISQTETNRSLNQAIMLRFFTAGKQINDLKVKWIEIKDQKLCKQCRAAANGGLDGDGVYNLDSVNPPPLHPNCRCILIPFLYKWFI
jgi:SPP1 gp7 family putative phage head morphogenesis protein